MDTKLENDIRNNFSEALNRFDFARVHDVMTYLDWCWWGSGCPPTQIEMISMVEKELFENALHSFKGEEIAVMSGGFLVRIYRTGRVEIQFIVTQSYSY